MSSDSALAVFLGQGTLGQNQGCKGGGEKQGGWGRAAHVSHFYQGLAGPGRWGPGHLSPVGLGCRLVTEERVGCQKPETQPARLTAPHTSWKWR